MRSYADASISLVTPGSGLMDWICLGFGFKNAEFRPISRFYGSFMDFYGPSKQPPPPPFVRTQNFASIQRGEATAPGAVTPPRRTGQTWPERIVGAQTPRLRSGHRPTGGICRTAIAAEEAASRGWHANSSMASRAIGPGPAALGGRRPRWGFASRSDTRPCSRSSSSDPPCAAPGCRRWRAPRGTWWR